MLQTSGKYFGCIAGPVYIFILFGAGWEPACVLPKMKK